MIKQKSFKYKFNHEFNEYNFFVNKTNNYAFNKLILYGFILVIIFFPLTIMMLNFLENKKNLNSFYSFVNIEKSIFI